MNKATQQTMFSSASGEWRTPKDFFDFCNREFHFLVDAGATRKNALCVRYLGLDNGYDALSCDWGPSTWCNPPYGRKIGKWIKKGYEESLKHRLVVMLLPGRIDTKWFCDYVFGKASEVRIIRGRLKFDIGPHLHKEKDGWCTELHPAPFPSILVVYDYRTSHHGTVFSIMEKL